MDPKANQAEQARIVARIRAKVHKPGDYARLAELRSALRGWVRMGGSL